MIATTPREAPSPPWAWLCAAALAGLATGTGFAPLGWWAATLAGVAVFGIAIRQVATIRSAFALGATYGLALMALTLRWMSAIDIGAAVGLVVVMSGWYVALGALLHLARHSPWRPFIGAGSWILIETLASRVPFGGFGWIRLGYAMVDSPLAGLLPLVGVVGLSFATALTSEGVAWLLERPGPLRLAAVATGVSLVGMASVAGHAVPPGHVTSEASVAWVQGGAPGGGITGLGPARTITSNQSRATRALAERLSAEGRPLPDFVVWPENSTDLDPGNDPPTAALVRDALDAIQRPILVGTILDGPGPDERRTASQWADPKRQEVGPTYIKRSIVPFGEWIPARQVLLPLFPVLEYVGAQSVPGTEPGVLPVTLPDGRRISLGVLLCFDVAFDPVVYDLADGGSQLLVVQSSNAMYQGTAQIEQQFAITRARAAELRREVLVVTTSGMSGLIDAHGQALIRDAGPGTAADVVTLPVRTGSTPATVLALPLTALISLSTAAWYAVLLVSNVLRERRRNRDATDGRPVALVGS